jgi:hypothetical protein
MFFPSATARRALREAERVRLEIGRFAPPRLPAGERPAGQSLPIPRRETIDRTRGFMGAQYTGAPDEAARWMRRIRSDSKPVHDRFTPFRRIAVAPARPDF